jgi:predicted NBD/HSP70 family sugar kinase
MAKFRVTVDTGGTFSDFVFFNEETGEITITKVPSTPKEPFQAILNGVKELLAQGVTAKDILFFLPRHDGRHERTARRERRAHWLARDRRISRHSTR